MTAKKEIPIKIFRSGKKNLTYDRQDEPKVLGVIRDEVLPKTDEEYSSVSVKVKRDAEGAPEFLVAYMLRKDSYTADVKKISIDKSFKLKGVEDEYAEPEDMDDDEEEVYAAVEAPTDYGAIDFVAATPVPEIPTAKAAVEEIHRRAQRAGLRSKLLLGSEATVANYRHYLRSGVLGFVNVGHGFTGGIVLDDGTLSAAWFSGLAGRPVSPGVVYFNSCQVFNNPLQPAVMKSGARSFIGGIVNLRIGPSENVCKCFWNRCLSSVEGDGMEETLQECEAKHYPQKGAHGISGDFGHFIAGHAIIFKHINLRGHHRHIFWNDRNLNHVEDRTLNDQTSSFVVVSGVWKFYRHSNYRSAYAGSFGPGRYRWVEDVGIQNDQVSSLRCILS